MNEPKFAPRTRAARLRSEAAIARALRSRSRAIVQDRVHCRTIERPPDTLSGGRIVRGAPGLISDHGAQYALVVRVRPLDRKQRRTFAHWCATHKLALRPCEFGLIPARAGAAEIKPNSLATAYIVSGNGPAAAAGLEAIQSHGFVLETWRTCGGGDRLKRHKLGLPKLAPRKGPRPARDGTRMHVTGCVFKENGKGVDTVWSTTRI